VDKVKYESLKTFKNYNNYQLLTSVEIGRYIFLIDLSPFHFSYNRPESYITYIGGYVEIKVIRRILVFLFRITRKFRFK